MIQSLNPPTPGSRHTFIRHAPLVDTRNIDVARESLISATLPHKYDADGSTAFYFRHRKVYLKTLSISDLFYRPQSYVSTKELEDFFCILVPICGTQHVQQHARGHAIKPGELYVIDPTRPLRQVISSEHRMLNIRVDRVMLDEFLRGALNRPMGARLAFATEPVRIRGAAASLLEYVRFLCQEAELENDDDEYNALVAQHVEQAVIAMLLTCLPNNYQPMLARAPGERSYVITRAERIIKQNITGEITVSAIAEAAGVSVRSVYYEFAKAHRMTPMQYVKQERLRLAHELFLRGGRSAASVSDTAYACGFSHLSKFARDYRRRFGELPRATLRRRS